MPFLSTIIDGILGVIFPEKCLSCRKNGAVFCALCLSRVPAAERETHEWIFPLYDYRDPHIKKALWIFKYKGRRRLSKIFAEVLYDKILEELSDLSVMENFRNISLIPVPLSKERSRERGYNQAELICKELMKINNLRHGIDMKLKNNILIKPKETEHQARIENRAKRLKNIVGSFSVKNARPIKNGNIILIDDITTTGATLSEARKVLKQSGARKIIAFTVAH